MGVVAVVVVAAACMSIQVSVHDYGERSCGASKLTVSVVVYIYILKRGQRGGEDTIKVTRFSIWQKQSHTFSDQEHVLVAIGVLWDTLMAATSYIFCHDVSFS